MAKTKSRSSAKYPARLDVDYQQRLGRWSTLFRIILIIPIAIIATILVGSSGSGGVNTGAGIAGALFIATLLMILFRQRYPRWWFDFIYALNRFTTRVTIYLFALTDRYPSTEDEQNVRLELDYPNVKRDLNRWLPLVKWLLALPHYIVLAFLYVALVFVVVIGWVATVIMGRYPLPLFDFVVGVLRWTLRVYAYAFLLVTDRYPPFSLS
ncbi:MAG: DUF4389 domain-containing protein [Actinobacteria bacterium]|nr:DUF4389 domain-containing protein [Actinomycetota bacterium]